jgi:hypothetical protein
MRQKADVTGEQDVHADETSSAVSYAITTNNRRKLMGAQTDD